MARVRAAYLLMLSRLCAVFLWLLRRATDIVSAGKPESNVTRDKQRREAWLADLPVLQPREDERLSVSLLTVTAVGALAGCSVAGTPVDWDAMACNYTASDGSIKSVPLD